MMTLEEIQSQVREHARATNITITSGDLLSIVNFTLRGMASLVPWSDLTATDNTMQTTSGKRQYDWLKNDINFLDVTYIGIQDEDELNRFKRVVPVRTEADWEEFGELPDDLPRVYRLYGDPLTLSDGEVKIEFRPGPAHGSKTIRRTGVREPDDLDANSETPFRLKFYDDIFALLISAIILAQRAQQARAQQLASLAINRIRDNTGKEITVREIQDTLLIRADQ